jgi:hypothetical protein
MRPIWRGQFAAVCAVGCLTAFAPLVFTQPLPLEPRHDAGQSITGVFEGWFHNPDGSFSLLFGYFNRNLKEEVDIPIGPNNRIEPGGPDRGQPTHFMNGRMWGNFTIKVPGDFGEGKLTWTIVANGKTTVIPANLKPDWQLSPFIDAISNTPPFISFESFDRTGPMVQGPRGLVTSQKATVGQAITLSVWTADDNVMSPGGRTPKSPISVTWTVFRGPAPVTFASAKPAVEKAEGKMPPKTTVSGKATTTATFSTPGEYTLQVVANDASGDGGGGFQCCWTTAQVKVSVSSLPTGGQ